MNNSLKEIREEANSIRKQKLIPVTTVRFDSPTPTPDTLKKKLEEVLKSARPSLLSLDYKETSSIPNRYSINDYVSLLETACKICHSNDVKCTNGGLEDNALILYYLASLKRNPDKLQKVLNALDPEQRNLATHMQYEKERTSTITTVEKLLESYSNSPLNYINVTWSGYSEWLFGDIARVIKEKTGKNIVSTEMEIPPDAKDRKRFLRYVRNMRLECVIWFFPFENLEKSDLVDDDGNLTEMANSLRSANRSVF